MSCAPRPRPGTCRRSSEAKATASILDAAVDKPVPELSAWFRPEAGRSRTRRALALIWIAALAGCGGSGPGAAPIVVQIEPASANVAAGGLQQVLANRPHRAHTG